MKLAKIVLVSLALSLTAVQCANSAQLQSPAQIVTMMDQGNLKGAEASVKEVLAVKDTAKVHYILAQVYLKQGRREEAQAELARANMMDPEHSYTDNAHYRPVADAIAGRVIKTEAAPRPAPPQQVVSPMVPEKPTDFTFLWWLLGLLGLSGVGYFVYTWYEDRTKKLAAAKALEASISALTSKVATLVQSINDAILKEKTSATTSDAKLRDLQLINVKVLNLYDRVKNTVLKNEHEVEVLVNEHRSLKTTLTTIEYRNYDAPVEDAPAAEPTQEQEDFQAKPRANRGRRSQTVARMPINTYTSSTTAPTPQTVVVDNSSSNMLSNVLMVDMVLEESRRREREEADRRRRAERDAEDDRRREREREEQRQAERERESSWSSSYSRSSDSGSSSSSWSSSSSSSDSGSNDSWSSSSSSSSDSGSSSSSWD